MASKLLDRLGVLTDEVSDNLAEALDWAAEMGLKHVEIRMVNGLNVADLSDKEVREIRSEVEARGLFVSGVASPVFKCTLDPSRKVAGGDTFGQKEESLESHFAKLNRIIEIAKLFGTIRIRIFSFWREEEPVRYRDEIVGHLQRAARVAEKEGVLLLVENEPTCNGGFASEVADIVQGVSSPAVKILWDPGNEEYGKRESFPKGYETVKPALGHMHLKDAYVREDGTSRCVPLGSGNVPLVAHLKALEADGYDGLFTIETHFIPEGGSRMTGTRMTLDGLRALVREV